MSPSGLEALRSRTPAMLDALEALVGAESPSGDVAGTSACAEVLAGIGAELLGAAPEKLEAGGFPALWWAFGEPRVLLLGHLDTVWPTGTVDRWPFTVDGDRATGPGAFDMKAGLVQGLHALAGLEGLDGVAVLVTADEESGSPHSRPLIEERARGMGAVLVLEPSADGALKVARKGAATYRIVAHGRAAHAGLDPEKGVNAGVELARQMLVVAELGDAAAGTTVTPTVLSGGTTRNTVPADASVLVDVRVTTPEELERVDGALRGLQPAAAGARLEVEVLTQRPPFPRERSEGLFARAGQAADVLGTGALEGAEVGGVSDGNLTAALGIPTLDGLGAVGGNAHAEGEWVHVPAMAERAALVAELVEGLRRS